MVDKQVKTHLPHFVRQIKGKQKKRVMSLQLCNNPLLFCTYTCEQVLFLRKSTEEMAQSLNLIIMVQNW